MTLLLPFFLPPLLCVHVTGFGFMLLTLSPMSLLTAMSLPSNTDEAHFQKPTLEDIKYMKQFKHTFTFYRWSSLFN